MASKEGRGGRIGDVSVLEIVEPFGLLGDVVSLLFFHLQQGLKNLANLRHVRLLCQLPVETYQALVELHGNANDLVDGHLRMDVEVFREAKDLLVVSEVEPRIEDLARRLLLESPQALCQPSLMSAEILEQQPHALLRLVLGEVLVKTGKLAVKMPRVFQYISRLFKSHWFLLPEQPPDDGFSFGTIQRNGQGEKRSSSGYCRRRRTDLRPTSRPLSLRRHKVRGGVAAMMGGRTSVFYDGGCPHCLRGVRHYQRLDWARRIRWVDLMEVPNALEPFGVSFAEAMERLHVVDRNGDLRTGGHAFAALWSELPAYRHLASGVRRAGLLPVLDRLYTRISRGRFLRRCADGSCPLPSVGGPPGRDRGGAHSRR